MRTLLALLILLATACQPAAVPPELPTCCTVALAYRNENAGGAWACANHGYLFSASFDSGPPSMLCSTCDLRALMFAGGGAVTVCR